MSNSAFTWKVLLSGLTIALRRIAFDLAGPDERRNRPTSNHGGDRQVHGRVEPARRKSVHGSICRGRRLYQLAGRRRKRTIEH